MIATPTRARGPPRRRTAVADFFLRLANPGAGWSRGWTSGCRGERPRPMGSPRDRRAVAHSGWGSQACSLSVDVVQRQRHAARFFFANGGRRRRRWSSRMDLAPPGRAAAAATCGVAARADHPIPVCVGEFGPVDHDRYPHARARPAAAAATAVADFFLRLANPGAGWSRGWTSGCRGERPRPMGSRRDRRAVAHSGWGSQACSLSVDVVQRQRHAAPSSFSRMAAGAGGDGARGWTSRRRGERPRRPPAGSRREPTIRFLFALANSAPLTMIATPTRARGPPLRRPLSPISFCVWRIPDPAGAGDGPRAAGASGRDLWGLGAIAGLLRTAAGGLRRALYPLTWCSGSGTRREFFFANGGRRRRRWSSRMDLAPPGRAAAAATCGVAARADHPIPVCVGEFGPVDHDRYTHARARPAAAAATAVADFFLRLANPGSGWSRGWTSGCRGERPRPMGSRRDRRAVAHSGWGSQACSLSVDVVQRQRRAAPSSFSRMATGPGGDGARGWTSRRRGERPRRPPAGSRLAPTIRFLFALANSAPLTMISTPTRARGPPRRRRPRSPISFCVWRIPDPAGAGDGPRAAGASGRDLWGLGAIAGLLRTAAGGLRRALYPLTWCSGSGARREFFFANGGRRRRRWSSRMDLAPPGRAAAAATCGVAARADHPIPVCVGEFGPVDHNLLHPRAREARRWRRRPRSPISFCVWRIPEPAGAGDGPRAAGASGRDLWGLGAIAGLLRTAAGGLRRALYPLTWCSGSGTRR